MDNFNYKELSELPITLTADMIGKILNISRASSYNLLNSKGFPTLKIGKRMIVPKEAFIQWIKENTNIKSD